MKNELDGDTITLLGLFTVMIVVAICGTLIAIFGG